MKLNLYIFFFLKLNRWNDFLICCIYFLNDVVFRNCWGLGGLFYNGLIRMF